MKKLLFTLVCLTSLFTLAYASFVFQQYSATPSTNSVLIEWVTKSEAGVDQFLILRSNDDKTFVEIGSVSAEGVGHDYAFSDDNVVFKDSQTFFYKLKAIRTDDTSIEETQSLPVHPNISGIYRTWGAIKAMFR
jgi:hypothetical protein